MGKKVTLAALPFFIAELFKKAYGASAPTDVNGVLLDWISLRYLARWVKFRQMRRHSLLTNHFLPKLYLILQVYLLKLNKSRS